MWTEAVLRKFMEKLEVVVAFRSIDPQEILSVEGAQKEHLKRKACHTIWNSVSKKKGTEVEMRYFSG